VRGCALPVGFLRPVHRWSRGGPWLFPVVSRGIVTRWLIRIAVLRIGGHNRPVLARCGVPQRRSIADHLPRNRETNMFGNHRAASDSSYPDRGCTGSGRDRLRRINPRGTGRAVPWRRARRCGYQTDGCASVESNRSRSSDGEPGSAWYTTMNWRVSGNSRVR
ncbi:MAG: hypothetical protein QOD93_7391, partial [Acetobacteraceae bacterium]|nr:hypothetical protein [Acetobacteraceae bacterium]